MRQFLSILLIILSTVVYAENNSLGLKNILKPLNPTRIPGKIRNIAEKVKDEVRDADIKIGACASFELLKIFGVNPCLEVETKPAYRDNEFIKIETYKLNGNFNIGDILSEGSPVYLNLASGGKISFLRLFEGTRGLENAPLGLKHIPVSSERFDNLPHNTYVSFKTHLNLTAGVDFMNLISLNPLRAGLFYQIAGDFNINIGKIKHNGRDFARLRVFSGSKNSVEARVETKLFDIFEIEPTGIIRSITNKFKFKASKNIESFDNLIDKTINDGHAIYLDYLIDMNTTEGRSAFDGIFNSTNTFKFLAQQAIDAIYYDHDKLKKKVVSNFQQLDRLSYEKAEEGVKAVRKMISAQIQYEVEEETKFGLPLWKLAGSKGNSSYINYAYTIDDGDNEVSKINASMRDDERRNTVLWGLVKKEITESNVYIISDRDKEIPKIKSIGITYQYRDKKFKIKEQNKLYLQLESLMPTSLFNQIDWHSVATLKHQKKARVFYHLQLTEWALKLFYHLSENQISDYIMSYLDESNLEIKKDCRRRTTRKERRDNPQLPERIKVYCYTKSDITHLLSGILSHPQSIQDRQRNIHEFMKELSHKNKKKGLKEALIKNLFQIINKMANETKQNNLRGSFPTDKIMLLHLTWNSDTIAQKEFMVGSNSISNQSFEMIKYVSEVLKQDSVIDDIRLLESTSY